MKVKLNITQQNEVFIVSLQGRFGGQDANEFLQEVEKVVGPDKKMKLVVELSQLEYIGSRGSSALVGLTTNYQVKFAAVSDNIKNIFEMLRLNQVFDIYPSVDKAIKSFASNK